MSQSNSAYHQWSSGLGQGGSIRDGSVEQQKAYEATPRTAPSRTEYRILPSRTLLDMNPSSPTESNFTGSGSSNYVSSSQWSSARSSSSPEDEEDVITPESDDNSDITIGPKIEELDDDEFGTLNQIEEAKLLSADASGQPAARKRGRPRKHPVSDTRKTAHTRSKTGCATCRRRKKRCDERKPSCLACEKNNVECEGYDQSDNGEAARKKRRPWLWRSERTRFLHHCHLLRYVSMAQSINSSSNTSLPM